LERTSYGRGCPGDLDLKQIRRLDAGSWKGSRFRGARVPTLEEIFADLGRHLLFNVELTNYQTPEDGLVEHVVDVVKAMGMESRVLYVVLPPESLYMALRSRWPPGRPTRLTVAIGKATCLDGYSPFQAYRPPCGDGTLRAAVIVYRERRSHENPLASASTGDYDDPFARTVAVTDWSARDRGAGSGSKAL
jgi:hypothetical protein